LKKISFNKKTKITSFSSKKLDISLFWDMPSYVRFNVLKDGKFLFGSKKIIHEVKVETISEYLDFKHILDRNIERVLI